jgi:hypothetical protein
MKSKRSYKLALIGCARLPVKPVGRLKKAEFFLF